MSENIIKVKATRTPFMKGGRILYQFHIIPEHNMGYDEFLTTCAARAGMDKLKFRLAWESAWATIAENLAVGVGTNADAIHVTLKITGSGVSADAKPDPKVNKLLPSLQPKGVLLDAMLGAKAVNITLTIDATLYSVEQIGAGSPNLLTTAGATILATGRNILTQTTDETGVCLLDSDGLVVKNATISRSDTNSVEFSFEELPENGTYTLAILTRNGQGEEEYGVSQLERKVEVVRVGGGESEE